MGDSDIKSPAPSEFENEDTNSELVMQYGLEYFADNGQENPEVFDIRINSMDLLDGERKYDLLFIDNYVDECIYNGTCNDINSLIIKLRSSLNPEGIVVMHSNISTLEFSATILRGLGCDTYERYIPKMNDENSGVIVGCIIFYPPSNELSD